MSHFADRPELVRDIFSRYPDTERGRRSALMPLLRDVQDTYGFVSEAHMEEIAALIGTTATEVRSVMSFYSTYHTVPTGRYHLQVCSTLMCAQAGSDELWDYLTETLDVQPGEVSAGGLFSVQKVECLGSCGTAPVVQLGDDGYYERVGPRRCQELLAAMRAGEAPAFDQPMPFAIRAGRQFTADGQPVGATSDDLVPVGGVS
ncbi:NADH-quinone oxidoreductase subunit NuoE [Deinococcus peraridilitoris]|uniref:NADH-quinone oxidoreductase, E subunit n=1 Tax=Deinococcus peraridilitoris (strain DSM 19664 / LMG 22246 / CIP 109416 / KR-200) TaxID=937777 RepID=L0A6V5_DEIPD|nr:NADH-quinone oxidoreductase subunit NuoE [Deinococcus peraridilitoris]AFZ68770.1 NADH-quinone oxidoreductase, E subunit [Deinococcus peraridilitoris DSM 19664]